MLKWQYFTEDKIFENEPNQNVYDLEGDDKEDVEEVSSIFFTNFFICLFSFFDVSAIFHLFP